MSGYRRLLQDIEGHVAPHTRRTGQVQIGDPLICIGIVIDAACDELRQHQSSGVTVGIEEGDALPALDQGKREVREQSALAAIRRPGDVHMVRQRRDGKADRDAQERRSEGTHGNM